MGRIAITRSYDYTIINKTIIIEGGGSGEGETGKREREEEEKGDESGKRGVREEERGKQNAYICEIKRCDNMYENRHLPIKDRK